MGSPEDEIARLTATGERLAALVDAMPDYVYVFDPEGRHVSLNAAARRRVARLGLVEADLLGRRPRDCPIPPDFAEVIERALERARTAETVDEVFAPGREGTRWTEQRGLPVRAAGGELLALVFISRDIHARKLAEIRLRLVAGVQRQAGTSDAGAMLDELARLAVPDLADRATPTAAAALHPSLRAGAPVLLEPEGDALTRLAVPLGPDHVLLLETTAASGRRLGPDELAIIDEVARGAWLIVENARLHEQLARRDARFRVAIGSSPIGVFELDRDGAVHALHSGATDCAPVAATGEVAALRAQVLAHGGRARGEVTLEDAGGRRVFLVDVEPLPGGDGVVGAAVDLTEPRQVQDELARAVLFRERVMGMLGHDLSNPLSAVRGLTALLLRRDGLGADATEVLEQIDLAARRMSEMIGTLLDFSRARFSDLPIQRDLTDLAALCARVIREIQAARPGRAIELEARGGGHGQWDGARVAQALSNLVGNALVHGAGDRPVRVTVDDDGGPTVTVAVTNEGPAIPLELVPGLFEPFRRGPAAASGRVPGLGLGLYIVRQIAVAHGGSVGVESSEIATTFTLRLPRG